MWALLLAGVTFFDICNSCTNTHSSRTCNTGDTAIIYKKDTLVVTGNVLSVLPFNFSADIHSKFSNHLRTLLLLHRPVVASSPEGVYELYITTQPPVIKNLSPQQAAFVTVLDLYSVTAPTAKQNIEIDISGHIKKMFLQHKITPIYVSILFGPIKLADGTYSSKAGELRFDGFSIVQVKK